MPRLRTTPGRGSASDEPAPDLARRRLAALAAELAAARGEAPQEPPADSPAVVTPPSGRHARRPVTPVRRGLGWLADRLPPVLQERPHFGAAQVGLVCVLVSVGLLAGAWFLVRAGGAGADGELAPPRAVATVSPTPSATGATPAEPASSAAGTAVGSTPSEGDQIVVDVVGKVRRPGIVVLPAGARVVDAVRAAGGIRRGVDRTQVNLARLLTDGEQVVVGVGAAPPVGGSTSTTAPGAGGLVNLNTADQATLETLPGVGPVTAAAILEWRAEHGAFTAVEELLEVSGIGDATLAEIAPHVTL